jgi:hypothetical protein
MTRLVCVFCAQVKGCVRKLYKLPSQWFSTPIILWEWEAIEGLLL